MMKVLVTGATGTQGGSVVDHLLSGEFGAFDVYGLTRDADGDAARALADRGVTVLEGDLTDESRMHEYCVGIDAVFCVTTFFGREASAAPRGDGEAVDATDAETEQGTTLATAAASAGVDRFVYSSVASADSAPLAHFESKARVEAHVRELGFDYTFVRPVAFMQNLAVGNAEEVRDGTLSLPLSADTALALVDADDIGRTVAMALSEPDRFVGETVTLAGDNQTPAELAAALTAALGHEVAFVEWNLDDYRATMGDELADMYEWFEAVGYGADPASAARAYGIDTTDFAAFLDGPAGQQFRSAAPAA